MSSARFATVGLCLVLAAEVVASCSHRSIPVSQGPWLLVNPSRGVTMWVDTSRMSTDSLGVFVWLRFDYAQVMRPMRDAPRPWNRMDAREHVDCTHRRASDIAMAVIDTAGVSHRGTSTGSLEWRGFSEHPLGSNAFDPLCRVLAGVAARRGA